MEADFQCSCCGQRKNADAFVVSRLMARRLLCKACMSQRNRRYSAASRHVILAGVSRRGLAMPEVTAAVYRATLEKHENKCVVSGADGSVVPLVLIRVAPGRDELVPVTRRLATKFKWVLGGRPSREGQAHPRTARGGPEAPPEASPEHRPPKPTHVQGESRGLGLVRKGYEPPRRPQRPSASNDQSPLPP